MLTATALAFALALAGLPPAEPAVAPGPRTLVGKVREVAGPGDRSMAVLVADDGSGEWNLEALAEDGREELRRLASARIRVSGHVGDPRAPGERALLVDRYDLLDVGSPGPARLGRLASLKVDGRERLLFVGDDGRADLLPDGWGRKLRGQAGARAWLVGERRGEVLAPLRFAILRPAAPPAEPAP